jgi:4-amino-4-deoxy-L-arabinose transferase-like glycosyltransferase
VTASEPYTARDRQWSCALLVLGLAAIVRLALAALIPLFPDEAYYWTWSRVLAPGYFDHPPGIALLIRGGTSLLRVFGARASALGVRLGPVVAGWIAGVATIAIARRIGGNAAALRAAIIITVLPLAAAGLILATPDSPLLAATAVGLYCVVRAVQSEPGSRASLRWWVAAGLVLGLAFSSKYTSIFLPVGVLASFALRPALRVRLREPGPYIACVIATIVFLPVLVWNARHGWISFLFQLQHGLSAPRGSALVAAWKHEGDFFGGQIGLASPILFIMLAIAVARSLGRRAGASEFALAVVAAVSFVFFVYSALRQRVEPNWPAPAYIPAIALAAASTWSGAGEKWLRAGVILAAAMSLTIYAQAVAPILPLRPDKDPIARAFGWEDVALTADSAARVASTETRTTTWLGGDRYQEASTLAFYAPGQPTTFSTNLSGRPNQFDLWPGFADRARPGDNLAMVVDDSSEPHAAVSALAPYFASTRRGPLVALRRRGTIATRRIWLLLGWRGGWPAPH